MSQQNNAAEGSKPAATTAQAGPSTTGAKGDEAGAKKLPQLGALEDDDEFEVSPDISILPARPRIIGPQDQGDQTTASE
jgi:hypothetical protein